MIRRVAMLCFALLALLSGPLAAAAQGGTPAAGATVGPDVGTAVSWIGNEGTELATVTVTDITDPFQNYDPSSPPQRGFHFVLLAATIDNTGTAPVTVDPSAFNLVDSDGFVAHNTGLYRTADDTSANPDLQYGDLAPGSSVTGVVGFQVFNGVEVDRVVLIPEGSRLITLVDERTQRVPLGTAVSVLGSDGTEVGQVTVNDLTDPFQDYDPSSPPQRGNRYVVIDVTVTNTGSRPLSVAPYSFYLVDTDGFLANPTYLYRTDATNPPDFEGGDIAAGASMSGIVAFQLLAGTEVAAVLYTPNTYDQQVIVGEPAAGGAPTVKVTPRAISPTAVASAEATAAAPASSADCQGIETWAQETVNRLTQIGTIFAPLAALNQPGATIDPTALRQMATQLQTLADDQRASNPPAAAEALNTALVDAIQSTTDAVTSLADATEANDKLAQLAAVKQLQDAGNLFSDQNGDIAKLAAALDTACPSIQTILGG